MLVETYARYGRPILVAETGVEGDRRASWLSYIADEVRAARRFGVPVEGICLYPIVNHPGWDDDRSCHNGLFETASDGQGRRVYRDLAEEIIRQEAIVELVPRGPG